MKISFKTKVFDFFRQFFKIPIFEKLLLKFITNKSFESLIIKFIPNNYQYAKETWRYANRNGINYKLNLYDYIDWWIYFGIKDDSRSKLYNLVANNNTIIDVGTNIGETLMHFANLTIASGEVHGFEPDSINFKRCDENLKLNHFKNITLNNIGLGDKVGKFNLKVDIESNRGGNRITNKVTNATTEVIDVITLDQYISNKKIKKINLIKIDVEGFELNVLKGAKQSLKQFKPVLFIELDDTNLKEQGYSAKELITYLFALHYKVKNAVTNDIINSSTNFSNCHYDIICESN